MGCNVDLPDIMSLVRLSPTRMRVESDRRDDQARMGMGFWAAPRQDV